MYSIDELEIIKSALAGDIIRQKKYLEEMAEDGGSDIRFEIWLEDTKQLYKKIAIQLMDMKAKVNVNKKENDPFFNGYKSTTFFNLEKD